MLTAAPSVEADHPSKHGCAKCGRRWNGSTMRFAVLVGFGDGRAHVIHHDCPDPAGREWWTEPAPLRRVGPPLRAIPKWKRAAPVDQDQIVEAAHHVYDAALRNRINFTAAVWRIPMDKAGVPIPIRRRAVTHAIRAGWIEVLDPVAGDDSPARLAQHEHRETRWRSLIYQPKRPLKGAHSKAGRPRP